MRRDRVALILLVLVVAWAPAGVGAMTAEFGSETAGTEKVSLKVTVTDGFNQAIADAKVVATWDGGRTSKRTASNGKVFISVPKGATVTLTVEHPRYTRNNPVVIEDATEQSVHIRIFLEAQAAVTVTNAQGEPVPNAKVTLYKRGNVAATGRTNEEGVFTTGTIEKGEYRVVAVKSGYKHNETTTEIRSEDSVTVAITEASVVVSFTVTDDHFSPSEPVKNARIEVGDRAILKTSANGRQTTAVPVNSKVTLTVTKEGYETVTRTVDIGEQPEQFSFTINRKDALSIQVDNQRILVGTELRVTVTDEYGERVAGAKIEVDGTVVGTTNENGVAVVALNETGGHTVVATKAGVTSGSRTVEAVEPAAEKTSTPTPTPTPAATSTASTATGAEGGTGLPVPGFGIPVALAALAAAVALLGRRRDG